MSEVESSTHPCLGGLGPLHYHICPEDGVKYACMDEHCFEPRSSKVYPACREKQNERAQFVRSR